MKIREISFPILNSTNTWAMQNALLLQRDKLTIVSADTQTGGRGRQKTKWVSPKGNLYASFCFFIDNKTNWTNVSQILALSGVELLKKLNVQAKIKWPNDLLVKGRKIGGILTETKLIGKERFICLGIGLNINLENLSAIDVPAASLFLERGEKFNVNEIKKELTCIFNEKLSLFLKEGFKLFHNEFASFALLDGSLTFKDDLGQVWKGCTGKINEDGSMTLMLEGGIRKTFFSGQLTLDKDL